MALTLSVGFVVDDAIVMLENIVRHMEMGKRRMEAALRGSREIGFTILSMTLSLVAVFIPVLFMGGMLGPPAPRVRRHHRVAILVSGFVSLTLTPMLCSRFLRRRASSSTAALYQRLRALLRGHAAPATTAPCSRSLRHPRATLAVVRWVCWWPPSTCSSIMPKGFLPSEDTGQIFAFTEAAQGISFDAMVPPPAGAGRDRAPRTPTSRPSCPASGPAAPTPPATPGASSSS